MTGGGGVWREQGHAGSGATARRGKDAGMGVARQGQDGLAGGELFPGRGAKRAVEVHSAQGLPQSISVFCEGSPKDFDGGSPKIALSSLRGDCRFLRWRVSQNHGVAPIEALQLPLGGRSLC